MRSMSIAGPRSNKFEGRQNPGSSPLVHVSTSTQLTTITTPTTLGTTIIETVTTTLTAPTEAVTTTAIITVYVPTTILQSPHEPQTTTRTITSRIISTTTKHNPSLTTPSASVSVATDTITVSSTIPTAAAASASSRTPLPDSSQRTITGLAVALAGAVIIACLAWLFWRRRKGKAMRDSLSTRRSISAEPKGNGPWNSQPATHSSGLGNYTPEPYKLPIQKSVAYGGFGGYFGVGRDSSSGVTYAPGSQTQTLNADGNEEFFPRSLSQCTEIGMAV